MKDIRKSQAEILQKLDISALNPMQMEAQKIIPISSEVIILSPTGSGKTLAFVLPLLPTLNSRLTEVQVLIVVPSRELAIQIEQVIRSMGAGFKNNTVYGGRSFSKDKIDLQQAPAILIGTPGRIADHIRRRTFSTAHIHTLILDEFDKSLEIGFEEEMKAILAALPGLQKKILTSATKKIEVPSFVKLQDPITLNYLTEGVSKLQLRTIISPDKDKLNTLLSLLHHLGERSGIMFCNFRESIQRVSDFLTENSIPHGCFYGGMEQQDRERALIKFRNGTHRLLIATDLAARGLDIPNLDFIIHYHLPAKLEEFIHRNGRTARMYQGGTAYILKGKDERLPDFIQDAPIEELTEVSRPSDTAWDSLKVSGGRRDKVSKGDIAGFFIKQGNLQAEQLGVIEIKQDCAFVAVSTPKLNELIQKLDNTKLKTKKVRVSKI